MPQRTKRLFCSILLLLLCFPALRTARAQSTEADLAARLLHHPVFLRGSWGEDKLRFDASGTPLKTYKTVPFTLAAIDISKVRLDGDVLAIEGNRVGVEFRAPDEMRFVALGRERIRIEVDGTSGQDFGPALDAIFARDLKDVPSACSGPWEKYADTHWLHQEQSVVTAPVDGKPPAKAAEKVKAPRVLKSFDPRFTPAARLLRFSGAVRVSLRVGSDGLPSDLRITQPAGLGLDEQAIASVEKYRFAPATRDGTPVPVELYVDVTFQIF